jgi:transcriptional regulator GlxA family with amidase domain
VGYASPVAFSKAFARLRGVGPGTVRRTRRHARGEVRQAPAAGA